MKNIFLVLFGLLFTIEAFAQEINFNVHKAPLKEYLALEKELHSQPVPNDVHYISSQGEAQPLKFRRKEKVNILPDPIVYYFFKKKDSTITYILYEWDVYNYEKKDKNKKSKRFEKALIKKYLTLKKEISDKFGEPQIERNFSNLAKLDPENVFEEKALWKPNDSLEIELYIVSSNYYEKKGAVTINPTHRIRLYIRNLSANEKQNEPEKLAPTRISKLDTIVRKFLVALQKKDLKQMQAYLSPSIINQLNEKLVNQLYQNTDFTGNLELVYKGIQYNQHGDAFTLLVYSSKDPETRKSLMLMRVVFDNEDKIIGYQAVKLNTQNTH